MPAASGQQFSCCFKFPSGSPPFCHPLPIIKIHLPRQRRQELVQAALSGCAGTEAVLVVVPGRPRSTDCPGACRCSAAALIRGCRLECGVMSWMSSGFKL